MMAFRSMRSRYAGWDIGRNKDLSITWLNKIVGDVAVTRGVVELSNTHLPEQMGEARALMRLCKRMVIDKSGMGLAIYEGLEREFWGEVEGITFTLATKESLAVHAKKRMQE
jgi:phage FluMu gp28-like protein